MSESKDGMLGRLSGLILTVPHLWGTLVDLLEKLTGKDAERWIIHLKMLLRGEMTSTRNNVISILRGRFNPAKFIGKGWGIIADKTDRRSLALTEVDPAEVQLVTMLKDGESRMTGERKLRRLETSNYIRLDIDIFFTIWHNQRLIPESWKEKVNGNTRYIFFDGTILKHQDNNSSVLCLYWMDGAWHWSVYRLTCFWSDNGLSAVLVA